MNCTDPNMSCLIPAQTPAVSLDVSFDASLSSDIAAFEKSITEARVQADLSPGLADGTGEQIAKAILSPLNTMNAEAQALSEFAASASADGDSMKPSDIVSLTVKSQEFMFHSQLTANIANRTADGIQQLFRQQG